MKLTCVNEGETNPETLEVEMPDLTLMLRMRSFAGGTGTITMRIDAEQARRLGEFLISITTEEVVKKVSFK